MKHKSPPEPPYRWRLLGTKDEKRPEPGRVIAWRHAAWRVIESNLSP